jgi:hypothetical protein
MTKQNKVKITEEPILEISIRLNQYNDGKFIDRLNWSSMHGIDLLDIFNTPIGDERNCAEFSRSAERKSEMFKKRLKQYIINLMYPKELENIDWTDWDETL